MKNIFKVILYLFAIAAITGCDDEIKTRPASSIKLETSDPSVTISQEGLNADVILSPMGSSAEIKIISNYDWELVEIEEDKWCKTTITDNVIKLEAVEFVSDYTQKTTIRLVMVDGTMARITASQKGTDVADIKLDLNSVVFPETGGSQIIQITSNRDWRVIEEGIPSWVTLAIDKELNTILVTATANEKDQDQTVNIAVEAGSELNNDAATLKVDIAKKTPAFINVPTNLLILPNKTTTINLAVTSNREWKVSSTPSGFTVEIDQEGIVITTSENSSGSDKESIIKLTTTSGSDPLTEEITVRQSVKPAIYEYTVPSGSEQFALLPLSGDINAFVDWGDGKGEYLFTNLDSYAAPLRHEYEAAGVYEVKIYGKASSLKCMYSNSGFWKYITALKAWGDMGVTDFQNGFTNTSIKTLPTGYKEAFANAKNINTVFADCANLTAIPADLFGDNSQLVAATEVFKNCISITTIPATILHGLPNLKTAIGTFRGTSITEIPTNLLEKNTQLETITNLFGDCQSLTTVPENLFVKNTVLKMVISTFGNCTSLTAVPAGLFRNNIEVYSFAQLFKDCTSLQTVPVSFFDNNRKITQIYDAFNGCTALTGYSPSTIIDGTKYYLYERSQNTTDFSTINSFVRCFTGCVNLTDYATIPANWK